MKQYFYGNGERTYKRELRATWEDTLTTDGRNAWITVRVIPPDEDKGWSSKVQIRVQFLGCKPAYVMLSPHEVDDFIVMLESAKEKAISEKANVKDEDITEPILEDIKVQE